MCVCVSVRVCLCVSVCCMSVKENHQCDYNVYYVRKVHVQGENTGLLFEEGLYY
jgi:hypothetical protein